MLPPSLLGVFGISCEKYLNKASDAFRKRYSQGALGFPCKGPQDIVQASGNMLHYLGLDSELLGLFFKRASSALPNVEANVVDLRGCGSGGFFS